MHGSLWSCRTGFDSRRGPFPEREEESEMKKLKRDGLHAAGKGEVG